MSKVKIDVAVITSGDEVIDIVLGKVGTCP